MSRSSYRTLDWPTAPTVFVTLDFECDFGTALERNTYHAVEHVADLVALLESFDVPLTCFVQTEVLDTRPETVETLRHSSVPIRFHPHSHTHAPRGETSVQEEIEQSTRRYREFFDEEPVGYRFPNGNVRDRDYGHLAANGYQFDASVFPSWRPGHFNNTRSPTTPQYLPEHDLVELPFTVYSNVVRIPTALSYCRVLGRPFFEVLTRFPPSTIVLNLHMHDLVTPPTVSELPRFYRLIYSRNPDGFGLLERLLQALADSTRPFSFSLLDDAHATLRADLAADDRRESSLHSR